VDKTFPGDMRLTDFNAEYRVHLHHETAETLEELMIQILGHAPVKGESIVIDRFELTAEEPSILGAKTIAVKSI
jgi:Mg2+/Co2+ transporter CorC